MPALSNRCSGAPAAAGAEVRLPARSRRGAPDARCTAPPSPGRPTVLAPSCASGARHSMPDTRCPTSDAMHPMSWPTGDPVNCIRCRAFGRTFSARAPRQCTRCMGSGMLGIVAVRMQGTLAPSDALYESHLSCSMQLVAMPGAPGCGSGSSGPRTSFRPTPAVAALARSEREPAPSTDGRFPLDQRRGQGETRRLPTSGQGVRSGEESGRSSHGLTGRRWPAADASRAVLDGCR